MYHFKPRSALLTVYKTIIHTHLDYGDIIYDQPSNASSSDKIESIQYNAALVIIGSLKRTPRVKIYHELGLEKLSPRRWMQCFVTIANYWSMDHLYISTLLYLNLQVISTHVSLQEIPRWRIGQLLSRFFFPNVICKWYKADINIPGPTSFCLIPIGH